MAYKRKTQRRPKRRYSGKRKMTKKTVRAVVKRVLAREAEVKNVQEYNFGMNLYSPNYATFDATNIFPLGPRQTTLPLPQGTGQGNRIGNRVHTRKLIIGGTLVPNAYNATTNPIPQPMDVSIWIFYDKTLPTALPTPAANGDFYQNGNGSASFGGDTLDMISPVNTDRYRVLAKRNFKLGYADFAGTGATPGNQNFANNDYKMTCNFRFDLTKHYPKVVVWNDNATSTPTTRGLFMMVTPAWGQGTTIPAGVRPLGMQFMQNYSYQDA